MYGYGTAIAGAACAPADSLPAFAVSDAASPMSTLDDSIPPDHDASIAPLDALALMADAISELCCLIALPITFPLQPLHLFFTFVRPRLLPRR